MISCGKTCRSEKEACFLCWVITKIPTRGRVAAGGHAHQLFIAKTTAMLVGSMDIGCVREEDGAAHLAKCAARVCENCQEGFPKHASLVHHQQHRWAPVIDGTWTLCKIVDSATTTRGFLMELINPRLASVTMPVSVPYDATSSLVLANTRTVSLLVHVPHARVGGARVPSR